MVTVPPGEILVLVAHPQIEHSRVAARLMRCAAGRGARVAVRDLYALYPDYWIDAAAEQTALAPARLVVWLHPIHWYGMPPLMKLWLDEVFAFGWAYGPGGLALRGKDLWLAASTGGPEDSYRPGWTCCAWPAPSGRVSSCSRSTTWRRAWPWRSWCASTSRSCRSSPGRAT